MRFSEFVRGTEESMGETKRGTWHQSVTLILALFGAVSVAWTQASPVWLVIPGAITVLAAIFLVRDIGIFAWFAKKYQAWRNNRLAKSQYQELVRFVDKANVYRELANQLQSYITWTTTNPAGQIEVPSFVSMSFDNWYNDIAHSTATYRIRRIDDLKIISHRFHDFLSIFNSYYLQPYSQSLSSGKARYNSEQLQKIVRQTKEKYDRFLHQYNDFCEAFNMKTRGRVLVAIHGIPPALDWSAAQPPPN